MNIKLGTRKSVWAQAAAEVFSNMLQESPTSVNVDIITLDTSGDNYEGNIADHGGLTTFVDGLSRHVIGGNVDAAVHTVKDIYWPTDINHYPEGTYTGKGLVTHGDLVIPAFCGRVDPRDTLVFREDEDLNSLMEKDMIKVGTYSIVRAAFFKKMFPDDKFVITHIRGNTDTRIQKLDSGEYDILILSMDGLIATKNERRASKIFSVDEMPPAPGQSIGALEVDKNNQDLVNLLKGINDPQSLYAIRAEMSLMKMLKADCNTPLGGICQYNENADVYSFGAKMIDHDGNIIAANFTQNPEESPEALGQTVAESLIQQGADDVTASWVNHADFLSQDSC